MSARGEQVADLLDIVDGINPGRREVGVEISLHEVDEATAHAIVEATRPEGITWVARASGRAEWLEGGTEDKVGITLYLESRRPEPPKLGAKILGLA